MRLLLRLRVWFWLLAAKVVSRIWLRLRWHPRRKKIYIYLGGYTIHFGRLNGRWSRGIDKQGSLDWL